jgi:amino acid adenylation domain-containing protein
MTNSASIVTLFEDAASRFPSLCGLRWHGGSWTYAELNSRANQLAAQLRRLGVGPDSLVGIYLERSFGLIMGILAILKAGGAYLPLDLACPEDRLAFMLEDSGVKVLITDSPRAARFSSFRGKVIRLDVETEQLAQESGANVPVTVKPENLAYVIYTSGSTGTPKGVLVTHENVVRLFTSTDAWFKFGPDDVWTLFHSCAFDFSVWEIFGALLYGGTLVVVPYDISRSAEAFHDLIVQEKVTVLNQTPSAFRHLVQADLQGPPAKLSLRHIIFGGEALEFQTLAPWFQRYGDESPKCINMYGITETTVHVTYRPVSRKDVEANSGSNIGIPIPDLQLYVVNAEGARAVPGEAGEILVGGKGVAKGYLNRPELTRERFIPDTFHPQSGSTLYRTGDRARYLANGDLEYLGRIDLQVKIRGFRIELNEIESILARHPAVRECVVIARSEEQEETRLVAYVAAKPQANPTIESLRIHLSEKLPEYMVPAVYVFLDSFPLTINGKLDRANLPAPSSDRPHLQTRYVEPHGELEKNLAAIWRKCLHLESVGTQDNFFDLGGDSLSAMTMMAQFEQVIGRSLGMESLLRGATIRDLVVAARDSSPATPPSLMMCTQQGASLPPLFFAHGDYFAGGLYCQKMGQMLGADRPFYSLAPFGIFGSDLLFNFEEMAARYVELIRSVQPKGPYHLGGFCNGAIAIYEVAQQLIRAGETVSTLVLLDPPDLYFFLLRRRINRIGKFLGLPDRRCKAAYQRITEGVEIWRDHGFIPLLKAFGTRLSQWVVKVCKGAFARKIPSTLPNLNFHYYDVMANYEPVPYLGGSRAVWIILRQGESERHPRQISYWSELISRPRFEQVSGTHLELRNTMGSITDVIKMALQN